jgi:glycosyltransferase involved in cell wall biosynthesis
MNTIESPPRREAALIQATAAAANGRPIVFLVNHAAFFVSHRLPIAQAAMAKGYDVRLLTGQGASKSMEEAAVAQLAASGIPHTRIAFRSASVNPLSELRGLFQLALLLRRWRPALVHCVSPKGILYGGLVARWTGVPAIVLAVSGMGYAFTADGRKSLFRSMVGLAYRTLAKLAYGHAHKRVIVQNADDKAHVVQSTLATADETVLIKGSGAQLDSLIHARIESKQSMVLLPARMLQDKGVVEFVQAAKQLKHLHPDWRFVLAGAADYDNPSSISAAQLQQWQSEGHVEWLGYVDDMPKWYAQASIVCLPSYREGMPKALLEAAAAGCAVVTTDVTGCRDAIMPGQTGVLVPVRDASLLQQALSELIENKAQRERYGQAGRKMAIENFGIDAVIAQTLHLYQELLHDTPRR